MISEISRTFTVNDSNANPIKYKVVTATPGAIFQINNAKLYIFKLSLCLIKIISNF